MILNGQRANQTNFNAAFASRTVAQTIAGGKEFQDYIAVNKQDIATTASITAMVSAKSFTKFTGSTATALHGITASVNGFYMILYNGSSASVTLKSESGSASAANRLSIGGVDFILFAGQGVALSYDLSATRWVLASQAVPAITALTGDVTATGPGSSAATIANDAVTNAKLANMATARFKGRTTAGTGDPEDLTGTQATAMLNVMVGDSGSGGTKGLVPAPGAGDAAAGKYLKADGGYSVPPGGSTSPLTTKGDLWGYDTANNRIPVGANDSVLVSDSTQALGVKWSSALSTFSIPNVTDWAAYTPTYGGFGTVTVSEIFWKRVGDEIQIRGKFTSGTTSGAYATLTLPNSVVPSGTSKNPSISSVCGVYVGQTSGGRNDHGGMMLIIPSDPYLYFGPLGTFGSTSLNNELLAEVGTSIAISGDLLSFETKFPITGWTSNADFTVGTPTTTNQSANLFYSGPSSGAAAAPTFRAPVNLDLAVISSLDKSTGVGIHGTNTNDNASAGYVGEYVESLTTSPSNAGTSSTWTDLVSISLSAGDWDITEMVSIQSKAALGISTLNTGISSTSGNSSAGLILGVNEVSNDFPTALPNTDFAFSMVPSYRVSIASTTTFYLKAFVAWSTTAPQYTCRLSARRMR